MRSAAGATLTSGAGASVLLTDGQTITDNGTLTFATGDTMGFDSYYGASQIVVNGTMTATGDTFATLDGSGASIQVESGGHLTAASSTFNINQLSLDNASVYGNGDLTGDTFNLPIYVPYGDVQYLAGNVKFEQVYINANTLPAGQTLALDQIGTNTSSLQYVFSGGFTIASGATLNVAPTISVLLTDGQTITDSGTLTFATGDTMNFDSYYGASQIVVNGTMTATGDTFATLDGSGASIQVESGGHLTAASSTFNINQLSLDNASVYGNGDLTGDTFNLPIYVPYGDVQYLAGNVKFEQVYINANTLPAGQTLALDQIGTNTSSLQYVFSGGFTIASGATLNVAPTISVLLTDGQTITDSGTLTFATGDTMGFDSYYGASQIVVNGTMTATGDTFATLDGSGASIQVESGGHLTAASSTFNINQLSLDNASVYGNGDLTGDTFNLPIYVPYGDVQYLAGNVKFEQVYINANTLPAGQTLALDQIGTNTSSLQYVFSGGFTIASGATLNVAPTISVLLTDGQTITDSGTLTFATGDTMDFDSYYGASQIVVNGTMTATGDTFATLRRQRRLDPGRVRRPLDGRQQHLQHQPALPGQRQRLRQRRSDRRHLQLAHLRALRRRAIPRRQRQVRAGLHQRQHAARRTDAGTRPDRHQYVEPSVRLLGRLHDCLGGNAECRPHHFRAAHGRPDDHRQRDVDLRHRRHHGLRHLLRGVADRGQRDDDRHGRHLRHPRRRRAPRSRSSPAAT